MRKIIILTIICLSSINVEAGKIHMRIGDQNSIAPYQYDMPFLLDGTIVQIGGSYYFKDRTKNCRHFLITNYDFPTGWTSGFPYKSAATISAPANDMELWAYDVDSFLYDGNHNPRQIPVVSLYQDIGYIHRAFCKHEAQILDGNGVETYEPRVSQIVLYRTTKTSTQLTNCNSHFGVPIKSVTHIREVGAGKTYSTIAAAMSAANTNDTIYVYQGDYNLSTSYFTINKTVTIKALGFVRFITTTGTYATLISNSPTIEGVYFITDKSYLALSEAAGATPTFKSCRADNVATLINASSFTSYIFDKCIFSSATQIAATLAPATFQNCYLKNIRFNVSNDFNSLNNRVIKNLVTRADCFSVTGGNVNMTGGDYNVNYQVLQVSPASPMPAQLNMIVKGCKINAVGGINYSLFYSVSANSDYYWQVTNNIINSSEINKNGAFFVLTNQKFNFSNNIMISRSTGAYFINHILVNANGVKNITGCKHNYNYHETDAIVSSCVSIGNDGTNYTDQYNRTEIIGNMINGPAERFPTTANNALHGMTIIGGINDIIKYNWFQGCGYALVVKNKSQNSTSGGIYCNVLVNNYAGIHLRGLGDILISNNTSYINNSYTMAYGYSYSSGVYTAVDPDQNPQNNIFKNNIVYSTGTVGSNVFFDQTAINNGCIFENGCIYGGQYLFTNMTTPTNYSSLATVQAAGLLLECLNENPNLKSTTELWPTTPITSIAEDLGIPYNVGLDTISTWGSSTTIPIVTTKNQPATWQIGAYVK